MSIVARSRAVLTWPASAALGPGGYYRLYTDDRDGAVDYDTPVSRRIPAGPVGADGGGWGAGRWGAGPWGTGDAGGMGYGGGGWGYGGWGYGAPAVTARTPLLADGDWRVGLRAFDRHGNPSAAGAEVDVTLAGEPAPAGDLRATAYDDGTDTLTLTWTLSADDGA